MMTYPVRLTMSASTMVRHSILFPLFGLLVLGVNAPVWGQQVVSGDPATRHHLYDAETPMGAIGQQRLLRRDGMAGYLQPIKLIGPPGASIAIYVDGAFQPIPAGESLVGLMLGQVYRIKISDIPGFANHELYPSLEIVGRLFPPPGRETACPVEVHLPLDDLKPAVLGGMVTRVIYLENPQKAFPERQLEDQYTIQVPAQGDPVREAERFGRPMVLVRIGSRVPTLDELNRLGFGIFPVRWMTQMPITQPATPPNPQSPLTRSPWRDELLLDGGDRGVQVLVTDDWDLRGLDSEDTIVHFDTLDGRRIVDASNQVAIYAPRFAATRRISGVASAQRNEKPFGFRDRMIAVKDQKVDISSTALQNVQLKGVSKLATPRGIETQTRGLPVVTNLQLNQFQRAFKGYEDYRMMRMGVFDGREKGRLAIAIDRAKAWNHNLSVQSTTDDIHLVIVEDVRTPQETVYVKTEKGRPSIRLVKVASTDMALPGDIVEFTIRFDNTGVQAIGNVTVVDKLTTRLEYVEGSAECSVPAQFSTADNDAYSQTLRWEIDGALEVGKGGVVRFSCRVR